MIENETTTTTGTINVGTMRPTNPSLRYRVNEFIYLCWWRITHRLRTMIWKMRRKREKGGI